MPKCTPKTDHCFCSVYQGVLIEVVDRITGVTTLHYVQGTAPMMGYMKDASVLGTEGWIGDANHQLHYDPSVDGWRLVFGAWGTFEYYAFDNESGGCDGMQFINYNYNPTSYAILHLNCVPTADVVVRYQRCQVVRYTECLDLVVQYSECVSSLNPVYVICPAAEPNPIYTVCAVSSVNPVYTECSSSSSSLTP